MGEVEGRCAGHGKWPTGFEDFPGVSDTEIERLARRFLRAFERMEPSGDEGMIEWEGLGEREREAYREGVREVLAELLAGPRHQP